jgi:shikimate kinase
MLCFVVGPSRAGKTTLIRRFLTTRSHVDLLDLDEEENRIVGQNRSGHASAGGWEGRWLRDEARLLAARGRTDRLTIVDVGAGSLQTPQGRQYFLDRRKNCLAVLAPEDVVLARHPGRDAQQFHDTEYSIERQAVYRAAHFGVDSSAELERSAEAFVRAVDELLANVGPNVQTWQRMEPPLSGPSSHAVSLNNAIHDLYMEQPSRFAELRGNGLTLAADFSGDNPDSKFRTIGLLIAAETELKAWNGRLQGFRERLGDKTMSYEGLHDAQKMRELEPYLATLTHLPGYCLAVALHKELGPGVDDAIDPDGELAPLLRWSKPVRHRALDVALIAATLLVSVCAPGSSHHVMIDEDEIAANPKRLSELMSLFRRVVGHLSAKRFNNLEHMTTNMFGRQHFIEDICAVPDLAADALMDLLRSADEDRLVDSSRLNDRLKVLVPWLLADDGRLTRIAVVVERGWRVRILRS